MSKKILLIILDGWGLGEKPAADAIQQSRATFVRSLYNKFPNTTLATCGEAVGLPEGQMGNSEVGHLNIGAGRVVYQELQRINVAIREGMMANNAALLETIQYCISRQKPLHLLGLVSDGGVHSHINHLIALLDLCKEKGLNEVYVHAFTDGRDCDPKSGLGFIQQLQDHMDQSAGKIASISGRYYAMDRDNRWERIQLAYDAMVKASGNINTSAADCILSSYSEGITDEFIKPTIIVNEAGAPVATIKDEDAVLCFNFRTDRCREITKALSQMAFESFGMQPLHLHYTTMTEYDATFKNVRVLFETDNLNNTLGQVLEANRKKQIRIAETEKYPHVTFFFNGGREVPFEGEQRIMIQSPKVATYDLQPKMSALELTEAILGEIKKAETDFICLNYANADMVGHTGVWEAVVKAVETVDACVERLVTAALESGYTVFLTADHGNADFMVNDDGSPNTAHTLNPVPLFIIDKEWKGGIKAGRLADLAPTILTMMELAIPIEMTGEVLIS